LTVFREITWLVPVLVAATVLYILMLLQERIARAWRGAHVAIRVTLLILAFLTCAGCALIWWLTSAGSIRLVADLRARP
jgi:hypothetical protein